MLRTRIEQYRIKENNLHEQYNNHVLSYLRKSPNVKQGYAEEILLLSCAYVSQREQTKWLERIEAMRKPERTDSINDLGGDLDLSAADIDALLDGIERVRDKLAPTDRKSAAIQRTIDESITKFSRIIVQFVDKRNVMRRAIANAVSINRTDAMLDELILLKSNLIKIRIYLKCLCETNGFAVESSNGQENKNVN
ncbi:pkip [Leucania separata nucleopolyhedrovirus]|uniref:Pkip n=1 Tax=Leucania separata nucleopolyhedrovirus TaxID=1307956 RepID=Q0IKW0_NPVLS|nr:pkip [Leucania separata nucleopolyhedrovirus]AAR28923.1 pkip [Leucania separata nucleopolyhedrovirus]